MTRNRVLPIVAIVVIVVTGIVLSQFASHEPDGLEYVAEQQGFDDTANDHTLTDTALADYGENLDGDDGVNTAVAAAIGLTVTAALAIGLFWVARSRQDDPTVAP